MQGGGGGVIVRHKFSNRFCDADADCDGNVGICDCRSSFHSKNDNDDQKK